MPELESSTTLSDSPIFIVGPGRSGTTLIQKILSAHSQISIVPETHYLKMVDRKYGDVHGIPDDFKSFWETYTSWVRFTYLGIDADRCLQLVNKQGNQSFQNIFRAVITAYKEQDGKNRGGEKSPSHIRYIEVLLKWFPEARFIIMYRDPRAVIASQLGTPWVKERIAPASLKQGLLVKSRLHELLLGAEHWDHICDRIVPKWRVDSRIHVVAYENLVRDPEKEVKSICSFLDEPFEEEMLTAQKRKKVSTHQKKLGDDQVTKWAKHRHHKNTEGPITTSSLEKWKKKLSKFEIALIEGLCAQTMKKYGYVPSLPYGAQYGGYLASRLIRAGEISENKARSIYNKLLKQLS